MDPELQEQPVPTSEITKMAVITITNPNSLNNFLINYTPDYFILQVSYYMPQSSKRCLTTLRHLLLANLVIAQT